MAVLKMPDGTRISVPDDATPEQVQQIAAAYTTEKHEASAQAGREAAWEETPLMERVAIGFAKPFIETAKGVKSLFTDLSQEDRNLLEAGKGVSGVAGTGGEVLGNLATFAVPGGVVARGGRVAAAALPRATALARGAVRVAPEIAAVAGMEALKAPTDERSRLEAARGAALGGAVGAGAGRVLKSALSGATRGVRPTPNARELLDQDVPLTPGMAGGTLSRWLEQRTAALPMVGGGVAKLQDNALRQWNLNTLRSVAPEGAQITGAGSKGLSEVQDAFTKAYGAVWEAPIPLRGDVSGAWAQMVPQVGARLPRAEATRVIKNLRSVDEILKVADNEAAVGVTNGSRLEQIDDMLRDFATKARKDGDSVTAEFYQQARNMFRRALPEDVNQALSTLDSRYARYAILQRAATGKRALAHDGVFTPDDLMGAVKAKGGQRALARGTAPLQQDAARAMQVFEGLTGRIGKLDRLISGTLATPFTPALAVGRAVLPREFSRRLLTGHYKNRPAEFSRALRGFGNRGITTRTTGAAIASGTDDDDSD